MFQVDLDLPAMIRGIAVNVYFGDIIFRVYFQVFKWNHRRYGLTFLTLPGRAKDTPPLKQ